MYSVEDESMDKIEFNFLNYGLITLNEITTYSDSEIILSGESSEQKVVDIKLHIKQDLTLSSESLESKLIIQINNSNSAHEFNLSCIEL